MDLDVGNWTDEDIKDDTQLGLCDWTIGSFIT